jgi:hypothetical protein
MTQAPEATNAPGCGLVRDRSGDDRRGGADIRELVGE